MQLISGIATAVEEAYSCSSDSKLAWELPYATGVAQKKKKKKKKKTSGYQKGESGKIGIWD